MCTYGLTKKEKYAFLFFFKKGIKWVTNLANESYVKQIIRVNSDFNLSYEFNLIVLCNEKSLCLSISILT